MNDFRRERKKIISRNPETGEYDIFDAEDNRFNLQDECIGNDNDHERFSKYCGCFEEPGGRCAEQGCGKVSCIKCHRHCGGSVNQRPEGCGKPLCREHSVSFELPNGQMTILCKRCRNSLVRKLRWQSVGRFFLHPFFRMED